MFSFLGMKFKEVEILGETFIEEVLLQDDDTVLDEVVVIFRKSMVEAYAKTAPA